MYEFLGVTTRQNTSRIFWITTVSKCPSPCEANLPSLKPRYTPSESAVILMEMLFQQYALLLINHYSPKIPSQLSSCSTTVSGDLSFFYVKCKKKTFHLDTFIIEYSCIYSFNSTLHQSLHTAPAESVAIGLSRNLAELKWRLDAAAAVGVVDVHGTIDLVAYLKNTSIPMMLLRWGGSWSLVSHLFIDDLGKIGIDF